MGNRWYNPGAPFGSVSTKVAGPTISSSVKDLVSDFVKKSARCKYIKWEVVVGITPYRRAVCLKCGRGCSYYRCEFRDKVLKKRFDF